MPLLVRPGPGCTSDGYGDLGSLVAQLLRPAGNRHLAGLPLEQLAVWPCGSIILVQHVMSGQQCRLKNSHVVGTLAVRILALTAVASLRRPSKWMVQLAKQSLQAAAFSASLAALAREAGSSSTPSRMAAGGSCSALTWVLVAAASASSPPNLPAACNGQPLLGSTNVTISLFLSDRTPASVYLQEIGRVRLAGFLARFASCQQREEHL